ncbi:hypothetical protein [Streptomyces albidoflavus]|uniref:hypothetical protein n=1 Tax=Streptomyces albidoflavus TaxID=1886 RepID=UPI0033DCD802
MAIGPVAGAAVMATGSVSVGCHLVGAEVLSRVLLGVAVAVWALVAAGPARRLIGGALHRTP